MRIPLGSSVRRAFLLSALAIPLAAYCGFSAAVFLAAYFSAKPDLASLQRAVRLQPSNAEYHYRLGRYQFLVLQSPDLAIDSYRFATALNPHEARYWLDLSAAYQLLGNTEKQTAALQEAIEADPTTPELAWEAANLFLVQGDMDRALREFRVVLQNDPYLPPSALRLCWRIKPDADFLLQDVIPANPDVYSAFLDFLISRNEIGPAAKVWARMAQLNQPVAMSHVFDYLRNLIGRGEVDQARLVWQQAATLSDLQAYQPSAQNLVVNGDFSLTVLNGGFDWMYQQSRDISLALDPTQSHSGHRSLLITFDSRGLDDLGVRQLIPVQPNTSYDFSANFQAEDVQGAGGPRFAIQDFYSGAIYLQSDELKDADFWKEVNGNFTTGPDTKLVLLHIQRVPAGSPMRGKLWIDGVRLAQADND